MNAAAKPWQPERVVTLEAARPLIESHVPSASIEPLGAGWDNTAFLVVDAERGDRWVFRFPRRAIAAPLLEREIGVMPALAPSLPLPVTAPKWSGLDPEGWPYAGYPFIVGDILALSDDGQRAPFAKDPELGKTMGHFVRALHTTAPSMPIGDDTMGKVDVKKRAPIVRALSERLGVKVPDLIVIAAEQVEMSGRPRVIVHGDLDGRHVLVDPAGRAAGVIDWGDVHLGDPATDLAFAFSALEGPARDAFSEAYGNMPGGLDTLALARFRAVQVTLTTLDWALDSNDAAMIASAERALNRAVA